MYPAGSDKDDGYGDLAQKSARFLTSDDPDTQLFAPRRHRARSGEPYGGDPYGGAAYGGDAYGAASEPADATAPIAWSPTVGHPPHYSAASGLTGALEGTITWRGAPPARVITGCGAIDNPSVRVAADHAVGGVLVYIEHVDIGRMLPSFGRPMTVGGTIAKHGCALAPTLQIITPLPAGLAVHGDATGAELRVTLPRGVQRFELQEAGLVVVQAQPGVTRIEGDDGSLGVAWIVAADTPYYALTDDRGQFRIDELAAGTYDVTFWQPPVADAASGRLVYGPPVITHRSVRVEAARPARLNVVLGR